MYGKAESMNKLNLEVGCNNTPCRRCGSTSGAMRTSDGLCSKCFQKSLQHTFCGCAPMTIENNIWF
ncbi:MAG: hypothetical protein LBR79_01980 [Oscillospiraceae bacterium]|jgi:ribosomal protein S14|nr:hypothetical protein [Oscillospiraceae bacterium]